MRFGLLRQLKPFTVEIGPDTPRSIGAVVVETARGIELGQALTPPGPVQRTGEPVGGRLLRAADADDLARALELERLARERDLPLAQSLAGAAGGAVRPVAAERLLIGPRLVVYFAAREWVDIPRLLDALAPPFAREGLELHLEQVSGRARARACGGAGVCGRTLCCSSFLRRLEPVTMRMAQVQGLTTDPARTAGLCGRLKCCIRYESPLYEDHLRGLPREGWQVTARRAQGTVQAVDVLRRRVLVRTGTGSFVRIFAEEIQRQGPPPKAPLPLAHAPPPPPQPPPERGWAFLSRRWWRRAASPSPPDESSPPPPDQGSIDPAPSSE